ncbi:IS110 family transposase [Candidatus Pollutiaquabacter sp.]|uniref:IS110 family transposase n=1 Tax=Candidatus Pollutiaquabacter sp. TaxID=3416354 RepID=UPI003CA16154|nr:transposase [Bacteroidota bacterium]
MSKKTLDLALVTQGDLSTMEHCQVDNTLRGIRKLTGWLKGKGVAPSELLVCMEYTGIYNRPLVNHLLKEAIALWLELPISIKRSLGLQRGKSDKLDAMRIAEYAVRFHDKARLCSLPHREPVAPEGPAGTASAFDQVYSNAEGSDPRVEGHWEKSWPLHLNDTAKSPCVSWSKSKRGLKRTCGNSSGRIVV